MGTEGYGSGVMMGPVGEAIMTVGLAYRKSSELSDKRSTLVSPSFSLGERDLLDRTSSSLPLLVGHLMPDSAQSSSCRRRKLRILYIGCRSQTWQSRRRVDHGRRRWGWASCLRPYILVPFVTGGALAEGRSCQKAPPYLAEGKPANHSRGGLNQGAAQDACETTLLRVEIWRDLATAAALNRVIGA